MNILEIKQKIEKGETVVIRSKDAFKVIQQAEIRGITARWEMESLGKFCTIKKF